MDSSQRTPQVQLPLAGTPLPLLATTAFRGRLQRGTAGVRRWSCRASDTFCTPAPWLWQQGAGAAWQNCIGMQGRVVALSEPSMGCQDERVQAGAADVSRAQRATEGAAQPLELRRTCAEQTSTVPATEQGSGSTDLGCDSRAAIVGIIITIPDGASRQRDSHLDTEPGGAARPGQRGGRIARAWPRA